MDALVKYFASLTEEERDYLLSNINPKDAEKIHQALRDQLGAEDPVWYIENILGDKLWEKQKEIVLSVRDNKRTAVKSCNAAGKSFIASRIAAWFLKTHPYSKVITTAPTHRQVEEVLWGEIRSVHGRAELDGEILLTQWRMAEQWKAMGFSTDDPNAFQGHHSKFVLVILDEATGVDPQIWEAARRVLTGEYTRLLSIGNPTDPATVFKEECDSPVVNTITISAYDTPNLKEFGITPEVIEQYSWGEINRFLKERVTGPLPYPALVDPATVFDAYYRLRPGNPLYDATILGEFPAQGTDTLIPLAWIERAVNNDLPGTLPHEFGVDVAYMGSDYNVIVERFGAKAKVIKEFHGLNLRETTRVNCMLIDEKNPERVKIDSIGIGAGVYEMLVEKYGYDRIVPVNGAQTPTEIVLPGKRKTFLNYRAEIYWDLRDRFERNEISLSPADEELINELKVIKYEIKNGQIKIESKEDMKKRLGRSPDRADALAYAFASDRNMEIPAIAAAADLATPSMWKGIR